MTQQTATTRQEVIFIESPARPTEYVEVLGDKFYGYYVAHRKPAAMQVVTESVGGFAHGRERDAEDEAAAYALKHQLSCYFRNDPHGMWASLRIQQMMEAEEADAQVNGWMN